MGNETILEKLNGRLVVSCQALENEPLHGPDIMAKMALAAEQGGAAGIRANTREDIEAIKSVTSLPVIGLVKRDYPDSDIFITPTRKEIDELLATGAEIIALDATARARPNNEDLYELIQYIKANDRLVMADISTVEEGLQAFEFGADCISTTLSGYTPYTPSQDGPDTELVERLCGLTSKPVFAEGRIHHPAEAGTMLDIGAHAVVVGSAITRPQLITERFVQGLNVHVTD